MPRRETSAIAFKDNMANGLIRGLRRLVYEAVYRNEGKTANEIFHTMIFTRHQTNSINPRFAELERAGVIATAGERPCTITNRKCLTWKVTDYVAERKDLKSPRKQKARAYWAVLDTSGDVCGKIFTDKEAAMRYGAKYVGQFGDDLNDIIRLREVLNTKL